ALAADRGWAAALFILGLVIIFAGFLVHMSKMNLGQPLEGQSRSHECPWKLAAMVLPAISIVILGLWLPSPFYNVINQSAEIIAAPNVPPQERSIVHALPKPPPLPIRWGYVFSVSDGTPSGFMRISPPTQGSSFLATLGWRTQSLWDCNALNTYRGG